MAYKSPFDVLIDDIFNSRDFLEYFEFRGEKIACVATAVSDEVAYTEWGQDQTVTFDLQVRKSDLTTELKKNEKIFFRGEAYKVDKITLDSAGLSYTIGLKK